MEPLPVLLRDVIDAYRVFGSNVEVILAEELVAVVVSRAQLLHGCVPRTLAADVDTKVVSKFKCCIYVLVVVATIQMQLAK